MSGANTSWQHPRATRESLPVWITPDGELRLVTYWGAVLTVESLEMLRHYAEQARRLDARDKPKRESIPMLGTTCAHLGQNTRPQPPAPPKPHRQPYVKPTLQELGL